MRIKIYAYDVFENKALKLIEFTIDENLEDKTPLGFKCSVIQKGNEYLQKNSDSKMITLWEEDLTFSSTFAKRISAEVMKQTVQPMSLILHKKNKHLLENKISLTMGTLGFSMDEKALFEFDYNLPEKKVENSFCTKFTGCLSEFFCLHLCKKSDEENEAEDREERRNLRDGKSGKIVHKYW